MAHVCVVHALDFNVCHRVLGDGEARELALEVAVGVQIHAAAEVDVGVQCGGANRGGELVQGRLAGLLVAGDVAAADGGDASARPAAGVESKRGVVDLGARPDRE